MKPAYVLTYSRPHRKTQDLLTQMRCAGHPAPGLLVLPWVDRKNHVPLFQVRPPAWPWTPEDLVHRGLASGFANVAGLIDKEPTVPSLHDGRRVLIAGAGILPGAFCSRYSVLNAHCGYLPNVRGLDSLKWAIHYGEKIGVTLHQVDGETDHGPYVERREIDVGPGDTLHSIAQRQYETEISMLVKAAYCPLDFKDYDEPGSAPTRRMAHRWEALLPDKLRARILEVHQI